MNKSDIIKAAEKSKNWYDMKPQGKDYANYEIWKEWIGKSANVESLNLHLIAAAELLKQVEEVEPFPKGKWLPIEKGYYDAEVYLCYFPENEKLRRYQSRTLLSVAQRDGATHYMIPQPPEEI